MGRIGGGVARPLNRTRAWRMEWPRAWVAWWRRRKIYKFRSTPSVIAVVFSWQRIAYRHQRGRRFISL